MGVVGDAVLLRVGGRDTRGQLLADLVRELLGGCALEVGQRVVDGREGRLLALLDGGAGLDDSTAGVEELELEGAVAQAGVCGLQGAELRGALGLVVVLERGRGEGRLAVVGHDKLASVVIGDPHRDGLDVGVVGDAVLGLVGLVDALGELLADLVRELLVVRAAQVGQLVLDGLEVRGLALLDCRAGLDDRALAVEQLELEGAVAQVLAGLLGVELCGTISGVAVNDLVVLRAVGHDTVLESTVALVSADHDGSSNGTAASPALTEPARGLSDGVGIGLASVSKAIGDVAKVGSTGGSKLNASVLRHRGVSRGRHLKDRLGIRGPCRTGNFLDGLKLGGASRIVGVGELLSQDGRVSAYLELSGCGVLHNSDGNCLGLGAIGHAAKASLGLLDRVLVGASLAVRNDAKLAGVFGSRVSDDHPSTGGSSGQRSTADGGKRERECVAGLPLAALQDLLDGDLHGNRLVWRIGHRKTCSLRTADSRTSISCGLGDLIDGVRILVALIVELGQLSEGALPIVAIVERQLLSWAHRLTVLEELDLNATGMRNVRVNAVVPDLLDGDVNLGNLFVLDVHIAAAIAEQGAVARRRCEIIRMSSSRQRISVCLVLILDDEVMHDRIAVDVNDEVAIFRGQLSQTVQGIHTKMQGVDIEREITVLVCHICTHGRPSAIDIILELERSAFDLNVVVVFVDLVVVNQAMNGLTDCVRKLVFLVDNLGVLTIQVG